MVIVSHSIKMVSRLFRIRDYITIIEYSLFFGGGEGGAGRGGEGVGANVTPGDHAAFLSKGENP
ncbi:hypothetical protein SLEP1_g42099 [Rubroshorea leprosula]|uniref:Uncharacterized protein n=1 Tax=Rubroshorea leprosula TaxID=152421 RepID=A0AAV5L933_9ROSI|nr:hypothetical protein SLEP1_g42099 [Rubroshorea leprosula]